MRYSAKEEALIEEIHLLTKRRQLLLNLGRESNQETAALTDRLEKRIYELAVLRGLENDAIKAMIDGKAIIK